MNRMFEAMKNRRPNSKKVTARKRSQERSISKDRKLVKKEEKKRVPRINLTLKNKAKNLGHSKSRPVLKVNDELQNKKE